MRVIGLAAGLSLVLAAGVPGAFAATHQIDSYASFEPEEGETDAVLNRAFDRCMAESGAEAEAGRRCATEELERLLQRLDRAVEGALARMPDAAERTRLGTAQRAWRDGHLAQCRRLAAAETDRAMAGSVEDGCRIDELIRRTLWLERIGVRGGRSGRDTSRVPFDDFRVSEAQIDAVVSPDYRACAMRNGGSAAGMRGCAEAELGRLAQRIAAARARASARTDSAARRQLDEMQDRWESGLQGQCRSRAAEEPAEVAPMAYEACRVEESARRILWLEGHGGGA